MLGAEDQCRICGQYTIGRIDPAGRCDNCQEQDRKPQGQQVKLFEPAPEPMPGQTFWAQSVEPLPVRAAPLSRNRGHRPGRKRTDRGAAAMIAGAALQKDSQAVRDSIRGNVKCSCQSCGAFYYMPAAQIRQGQHHCRCGAGPMLTANLLACSQLEPDRLDEHPDHAEAMRDELRADLAAVKRDQDARSWTYGKGSGCASCGWRRPDRADPDYWYCRKCSGVNERCPDGSLGYFKCSPFSPEAEEANGRMLDAPSRVAVSVHRPERVAAPNPDLPF